MLITIIKTVVMETENSSLIMDDLIKTKSSSDSKLDGQMISSIISVASSLTSPVDSGVQLLDSESEITSLMSVSGFVSDNETCLTLEEESAKINGLQINEESNRKEAIIDIRKTVNDDIMKEKEDKPKCEEICLKNAIDKLPSKLKTLSMTKSDIDNHNTQHFDVNSSPAILPVGFTTNPPKFHAHCDSKFYTKPSQKPLYKQATSKDVFEFEPVLIDDKKQENTDDLMNVSLTSYELLDYTLQNSKCDNNMHVSMSEEVNESVNLEQPKVCELQEQPNPDDQIVFRRQRRKKSKSDTPKKRVSFHEDILNSTKIDDIHINHGFITHEFDMSMSFFDRGFTRKPDVIKGRYSWAAEGDSPYYPKSAPEREVKSDIYIHHARFSSSSSSSSASISSSIDEEDTTGYSNSNSDDAIAKKEPSLKLPKSSCLKKTKSSKRIDTNIVQEETNLKKRKSESNLLDSNIFGSLKNIFNFSTSVPLAERGVPEGQEDIILYSSSETAIPRQRKYSGDYCIPKGYEGYEVQPAPVKKIGNLNLELAKTNLKLTTSEGFYPNYPNNQTLPNNIILCDSNVYEHKGISYSYEYEKFQKTFEQQNKPKSSTIYQTLLNELNFFKRREKKAIEKEAKESFEILSASTPIKDYKLDDNAKCSQSASSGSIKKYTSSATIDFSDSDTTWDVNEGGHTRHLNSPKRKPKLNNSSYSLRIDNFDDRSDSELLSAKSLNNIRASTSKTSLINRFLKNVTMKKMIDLKLQKKQKTCKKYLSLYIPGVKANRDQSKQLDMQIEREIIHGKKKKFLRSESDMNLYRFKNEIFNNYSEELVKIFPIFSAYTTSGENKPLVVVLSSTTLYITGFKHNNSYCNFFVLPYTELNTILIGPNAQTIHLSNYDNDMQCIITTGSETLTDELVGQLEMAMRKDENKPRLSAVKQLSMRDMVNLRKSICKQTTVGEDEEYFHYSIVNIQDYNVDICETPLGPSKEGPLMFKMADTDTRWETAYFILKAGILYMLSSPSHRLPMRVLPLINGSCQGAWRIYNCNRPHTFQVQVGTTTLHLAAPDEYVASEWLQALVHAASKTYNHREKFPAQSCSLLMTSEHILCIREAFSCTLSSSLGLKDLHHPIKGAQAISCASIADITAFRLPCAEQSWCILEFSCREVHETSGDWIIYFSTNAELEKFISTLEMLWTYHNDQGDSFPLSTIPETDSINRKCVDTYNMIKNTWLSLQINLQSFDD